MTDSQRRRSSRPSAWWYVLPGLLLVAALLLGAWGVVIVVLEKGADTFGDAVDSQPSSAYVNMAKGTRYRIKVIGDEPAAPVTCTFAGPGAFRLRFPPPSKAERDKIATTVGLFTAPRDGRFEVTCFEAGEGQIYGVRVRGDYATELRTTLLMGGAAGALAVASFATVLIVRRFPRPPRAGRRS